MCIRDSTSTSHELGAVDYSVLEGGSSLHPMPIKVDIEMSWLLKGTLLVDNPQPLAKASAGNMPSEIAPRRGVGEHGSETVEQACCNISW